MGTFQMAILLCLNSQTSISVKELQESTQLPEKDLIKQVQSLLESKIITLNPLEPMTAGKPVIEGLNQETVVHLNMEYSNKKIKFKINAAVQKETPQENEMTQQSVDEDRKLFLQATIVRIMKSRKNLNHNLLIQEVVQCQYLLIIKKVFQLFMMFNLKKKR